MGQRHKTKSHKSRVKLSNLEKMQFLTDAPKEFHKPTSDEVSDLIIAEHKHPCGYSRNFLINEQHTEIYSRCTLNTKPCPYHQFNIQVSDCKVYQNWLSDFIKRGYKE